MRLFRKATIFYVLGILFGMDYELVLIQHVQVYLVN